MIQRRADIATVISFLWTPEENARNWIEAISALLTAVSVLFGVAKYLLERHWNISVDEVGKVMLDEQKMNYFVVKPPNPFWACVPWKRQTAKIPKLPSISMIFRAGEHNYFTSSMFDWIQTRTGGGIVGWRSLYDAFFDEMAWQSIQDNKSTPRAIRKALDAARKHVKSIKADPLTPDSKNWDRHLLYEMHVTNSSRDFKLFRNTVEDTEKGHTKDVQKNAKMRHYTSSGGRLAPL